MLGLKPVPFSAGQIEYFAGAVPGQEFLAFKNKHLENE
jgi:hypothetical protein